MVSSLTSNNTKELLDPHVDVDPTEELVHVTSPLLQDRASMPSILQTGKPGNAGIAGSRLCPISSCLTSKHFAQPAQHQLQPLFTQNMFQMKGTNT